MFSYTHQNVGLFQQGTNASSYDSQFPQLPLPLPTFLPAPSSVLATPEMMLRTILTAPSQSLAGVASSSRSASEGANTSLPPPVELISGILLLNKEREKSHEYRDRQRELQIKEVAKLHDKLSNEYRLLKENKALKKQVQKLKEEKLLLSTDAERLRQENEKLKSQLSLQLSHEKVFSLSTEPATPRDDVSEGESKSHIGFFGSNGQDSRKRLRLPELYELDFEAPVDTLSVSNSNQ